MRKIVVISGKNRPRAFGGGPDGYVHLLLKAFKQRSGAQPFEIMVWFDGCLHALDKVEPLTEASRALKITKHKLWLRNKWPRIYYVGKQIYDLYRKWLLQREFARIKSGCIVLHANDPFIASIAPDRCHLLYTHHAKGSTTREERRSGVALPPYLEDMYRKYEQKAIKKASLLVFPSKSSYELLCEDYPQIKNSRNVSIVYTGVEGFDYSEESLYSRMHSKKRIFVNISHHVPEKNISLALRVYAKVRSKLLTHKIESKFINIGAGPCTSQIVRLTEELHVTDSVEFRGFIPRLEVKRILEHSHIFIHTPSHVVFDLSLLEAMSCGLPIVATGILGNREALGEDYSYLIYENKLEDAVEKTFNLCINPEEAVKIGKHNRARFENNFTLSKMAERYALIYNELLNTPY